MLVSGSKKGSRTPLLVSSSCRDRGSSKCFYRQGETNSELGVLTDQGVENPSSW